MDISGGYTRVSQFSAQLPASVLTAGNKESLKCFDEQNQSQPHSTTRFNIRSAKERQDLLTKANSFKYDSFDSVSRSIKECREEMPRVHDISSSDNDVTNNRLLTNQVSVAKKADRSIGSGPTTTRRGRTEWRQVDLSNRSKSLDWRVSKRKGHENRVDAICNNKTQEESSIQLSLMKNIELSTGPEMSSTAQKHPNRVESLTTNIKERRELKHIYLSNRSKSVDWGESKSKEGQENPTDVISNTNNFKRGSMKCSESLEDIDAGTNISELDNPLKKVSVYIQPFSGYGQRKQHGNGLIFSPASETSPVRTMALAQSFPSRIKANHSQERIDERKGSWYSGLGGTKPDQSGQHFSSGVTSSNISEFTRNRAVMGKNGHTVLDHSDATLRSEVLHGIITPDPFVSAYSTKSNDGNNPNKYSVDKSISVSSPSDTNAFSYKLEKYGTFPKAPCKKEKVNFFTVPDTSFVFPNGKANTHSMSPFFKDNPLRQNSISSISSNSISNDRLLIGNSIGLGTHSLDRKKDRHITGFTFSAQGLSNNNSIQKSTKYETEMPEELTKGMATIPGKQSYNSQEGVIPWTKPQPYQSLTANREKHLPERCFSDFGSSGNPSQKNEGLLDKVQIPCLASVRSKIDKFEALAQQSQSSSGLQPPRRAFSVIEMPKVVPSLNKAYSDRSLGKRLGSWNREFIKEDLFSKSDVSNEVVSKKDLNGPVHTITQDKECSTLKTLTSGPKSNEPGVTQTLKQLEELPSNQRNGRFTMLNKNLDEPDFFKGSKSYQPSKSSELSYNKVRNDLTSSLSHNLQKSSGLNNLQHAEFKDSEFKNNLSTKDFNKTFRNESTSLLQNVYSSPKEKTPFYPFHASGAMPSVQGLGDLSNPYSTIKDKKGAEKVIRWIMDKGADDEIGDDLDDEDDEGTERSYDSDSGESSVTITSNMSIRSFSMSLVDLCSLGGLELPPLDGGGSRDDEDWMSKRTVSMSSDVSALSSVTLLDMEELECLLNDVRGLDDNSLENYDDVHVVVLHKEAGGGLGFTVAGGVDQNKPVTVHKVLPNGIAAREGSIHEGDQVLSINGTALHNSTHKEALYTMKKARGRPMTVVVIRRGDVTETWYSLKDNAQKPVGTSGSRIRVLLNKCSSDLGFSLEGGVGSTLGDKPLTVQRLFQGGPVGKVFPGDELLEVEGQSLEGLRRLEVWQLIKRLPTGPVEVLLQRPYQQY